MSATSVESGFAVLAICCVIGWTSFELARTRRKLRIQQSGSAGLRLDLDAALSRITQLQGYLSHPESWRTVDPMPVPAPLADPTPPDRWSLDTTGASALTALPAGGPEDYAQPGDRGS